MSAAALAHTEPATAAPRRPRLLSHAGRWGRARRWLPADARVVVDVGCAFGYGTAAIAAGGPPQRRVIGVERDPAHLADARRRFPWVSVVEGDAANLPFPDETVDAVTMLDVLEHVADAPAVLEEVHRVLRRGGVLVLSVPHRGVLTPLDSTNVYPALVRRFPSWLPMDAADDCDGGRHHHYSVEELRKLLGERFTVDRVARTGLGTTELLHLALLVVLKGLLRRPGAYRALMPAHMLLYLVDDLVPAGPAAYYVAVRAVAR